MFFCSKPGNGGGGGGKDLNTNLEKKYLAICTFQSPPSKGWQNVQVFLSTWPATYNKEGLNNFLSNSSINILSL